MKPACCCAELSVAVCMCCQCAQHPPPQVMDAITRHLDLGSYLEWSEEHRTAWLMEGEELCLSSIIYIIQFYIIYVIFCVEVHPWG